LNLEGKQKKETLQQRTKEQKIKSRIAAVKSLLKPIRAFTILLK